MTIAEAIAELEKMNPLAEVRVGSQHNFRGFQLLDIKWQGTHAEIQVDPSAFDC